MDLSIVIVNYNVKYFLEQCLHSVERASRNMETEVFVVDNNSVDGSCAMVQEKFSCVKLIRNDENLGFSVANNQAIRESSGKYVLLLNPDTVIEEDTLDKCMSYMDEHPDAGGLGVKMIDGNGEFLPESKRALPSPGVAFYKIFGLSRLFPKSRIFGRYHLGYLDRDKVHSIDILPGAFMMLRKSALDEVGLLDETFFMYGEDIDLSYRLIKAGYKNIYFPETTIIHYKGESTKKGSLNYVMTFYDAMRIFARKHFSRNMARTYSLIINMAIYFRAFLALSRRFVRNFTPPLTQAALIYLGFYMIKPIWEQYKFQGTSSYPIEYMTIVVPIYILLWLLSLFFSGAYDTPVKPFNIFKGIFIGTGAILVIYALLPESLRFSRMLLLIGTLWATLSAYLLSILFHITRLTGFRFEEKRNKKLIIVGKHAEASRVQGLLSKAESNLNVVGYVNPEPRDDEDYTGHINQLGEIIKINKIDELIFCASDISSQDIIGQMMTLANERVQYKIAPPESLSIIGSHSINTPGDVYLIDFESITKPSNKRVKRLFDFLSSLLLIVFYPVLLFAVKNPGQAFLNILNVLSGKYSWVGFHPSPDKPRLPSIRPGILFPSDALGGEDIPQDIKDSLNLMYVKNYSVFTDAGILMRSLPKIGRKQ
ncbi:MAG TPA: glycosyltransferase [Bacteroides sp.]|nr:glycosyltransferase [Bacteroides sp.]